MFRAQVLVSDHGVPNAMSAVLLLADLANATIALRAIVTTPPEAKGHMRRGITLSIVAKLSLLYEPLL